MKGCQKCCQERANNDIGHLTEVNKGARKIMTEIPDQLASVFKWTIYIGVFIVFFMVSTYYILKYETSAKSQVFNGNTNPVSSELRSSETMVVNVTTREFCSTMAKDLYSLEQLGYTDTERRVSKLMATDIGVDDVHYVLINSTHIPWLTACSLESALKAVGNESRVNVFVVYGVNSERYTYGNQPVSSLSTSLDELAETYGTERLNVVPINLEECMEGSPFQGMDLIGRRPAFAEFAVQLVVLWQFGGTMLDAGTVAVRGEVYRAHGTAVEYGDRTISSPAACHAFVFDTMLCAYNFAVHFLTGDPVPFDAYARRHIAQKTIERTKCTDMVARPIADTVVCRDGVVDGRCYYVEVDHVPYDPKSYVHGFCPVASHVKVPWRLAKRTARNTGGA